MSRDEQCSADIAGLVAAIQAAWDASPSAPSSFRLAKIAAEVAAKQFGAPAQPTPEPIAFVPVHPRNGPLWSDTYAAVSFSERSPNYPKMALYAAQPPAAPVDNGSMYGEYTPVTVRASTAPLQSCSADTESEPSAWLVNWDHGSDVFQFRENAERAIGVRKNATITPLYRAVPQPMPVTEKPRPSDCPWPVDCMWRHVPTVPEIGLHLCSRFGCPHTTSAASAVSRPQR